MSLYPAGREGTRKVAHAEKIILADWKGEGLRSQARLLGQPTLLETKGTHEDCLSHF